MNYIFVGLNGILIEVLMSLGCRLSVIRGPPVVWRSSDAERRRRVPWTRTTAGPALWTARRRRRWRTPGSGRRAASAATVPVLWQWRNHWGNRFGLFVVGRKASLLSALCCTSLGINHRFCYYRDVGSLYGRDGMDGMDGEDWMAECV